MSQTIIKGDLVKITDGSFAVRIDDYEADSSLTSSSTDIFEVIRLKKCWGLTDCEGDTVHDTIIKNTRNGEVYLHSKSCIELAKIKEVTVADIEKKYGCKVKIIK